MYVCMNVCVYIHVYICMYICMCTMLWPRSLPIRCLFLSPFTENWLICSSCCRLLCAKCCNYVLCGTGWGSKGLFCCQIAIAISDTLIVQTSGMASMMTVDKCFLMNNQLWTQLNVFFRSWIAQILSSLLEICHMLMDMLLRYVLVHMSYIHVCDVWER